MQQLPRAAKDETRDAGCIPKLPHPMETKKGSRHGKLAEPCSSLSWTIPFRYSPLLRAISTFVNPSEYTRSSSPCIPTSLLSYSFPTSYHQAILHELEDMASATPEEIASWPAPNFDHPENRGPILLGLTAPFMALVVVFTAMRFYGKGVLRQALGIDDWVMLAAGVCGFKFSFPSPRSLRANTTPMSRELSSEAFNVLCLLSVADDQLDLLVTSISNGYCVSKFWPWAPYLGPKTRVARTVQ